MNDNLFTKTVTMFNQTKTELLRWIMMFIDVYAFMYKPVSLQIGRNIIDYKCYSFVNI